jgi:hypothetical protein
VSGIIYFLMVIYVEKETPPEAKNKPYRDEAKC